MWRPQWGEWCWEDREYQAAAEVSLCDESKLSRHSSVREDHQGGASPHPEQVLFDHWPPTLCLLRFQLSF